MIKNIEYNNLIRYIKEDIIEEKIVYSIRTGSTQKNKLNYLQTSFNLLGGAALAAAAAAAAAPAAPAPAVAPVVGAPAPMGFRDRIGNYIRENTITWENVIRVVEAGAVYQAALYSIHYIPLPYVQYGSAIILCVIAAKPKEIAKAVLWDFGAKTVLWDFGAKTVLWDFGIKTVLFKYIVKPIVWDYGAKPVFNFTTSSFSNFGKGIFEKITKIHHKTVPFKVNNLQEDDKNTVYIDWRDESTSKKATKIREEFGLFDMNSKLTYESWVIASNKNKDPYDKLLVKLYFLDEDDETRLSQYEIYEYIMRDFDKNKQQPKDPKENNIQFYLRVKNNRLNYNKQRLNEINNLFNLFNVPTDMLYDKSSNFTDLKSNSDTFTLMQKIINIIMFLKIACLDISNLNNIKHYTINTIKQQFEYFKNESYGKLDNINNTQEYEIYISKFIKYLYNNTMNKILELALKETTFLDHIKNEGKKNNNNFIPLEDDYQGLIDTFDSNIITKNYLKKLKKIAYLEWLKIQFRFINKDILLDSKKVQQILYDLILQKKSHYIFWTKFNYLDTISNDYELLQCTKNIIFEPFKKFINNLETETSINKFDNKFIDKYNLGIQDKLESYLGEIVKLENLLKDKNKACDFDKDQVNKQIIKEEIDFIIIGNKNGKSYQSNNTSNNIIYQQLSVIESETKFKIEKLNNELIKLNKTKIEMDRINNDKSYRNSYQYQLNAKSDSDQYNENEIQIKKIEEEIKQELNKLELEKTKLLEKEQLKQEPLQQEPLQQELLQQEPLQQEPSTQIKLVISSLCIGGTYFITSGKNIETTTQIMCYILSVLFSIGLISTNITSSIGSFIINLIKLFIPDNSKTNLNGGSLTKFNSIINGILDNTIRNKLIEYFDISQDMANAIFGLLSFVTAIGSISALQDIITKASITDPETNLEELEALVKNGQSYSLEAAQFKFNPSTGKITTVYRPINTNYILMSYGSYFDINGIYMVIDSNGNITYEVSNIKLDSLSYIENKPIETALVLAYLTKDKHFSKLTNKTLTNESSDYVFNFEDDGSLILSKKNKDGKLEEIESISMAIREEMKNSLKSQQIKENVCKEIFGSDNKTCNKHFISILGRAGLNMLQNIGDAVVTKSSIINNLNNAKVNIKYEILKNLNWKMKNVNEKKVLVSVDEWIKILEEDNKDLGKQYKEYLNKNTLVKDLLESMVDHINNNSRLLEEKYKEVIEQPIISQKKRKRRLSKKQIETLREQVINENNILNTQFFY